MKFSRIVAMLSVAISLFAVADVFACDCSGTNLTPSAAQSASNVFLFKLMSAEVEDGNGTEGGVVGNVQVLKTYIGKGSQYKRIRSHIRQCCGTRLIVGFSYLAFTSEQGTAFTGNSGSILDINITSYNMSQESVDEMVERILNEDAAHEARYWGESWRRLQIVPVPNPPCKEITDDT